MCECEIGEVLTVVYWIGICDGYVCELVSFAGGSAVGREAGRAIGDALAVSAVEIRSAWLWRHGHFFIVEARTE